MGQDGARELDELRELVAGTGAEQREREVQRVWPVVRAIGGHPRGRSGFGQPGVGDLDLVSPAFEARDLLIAERIQPRCRNLGLSALELLLPPQGLLFSRPAKRVQSEPFAVGTTFRRSGSEAGQRSNIAPVIGKGPIHR